MTKPHLENFFISREFIDSMDYNEVDATFEAMCECGQAMFFYCCINLGNGYRKRLRVHSNDFNVTKTLKKEISI